MATTSLGRLTLDLAVSLSEFTDGLTQAERETRDRAQQMGDSVGKFKEKLLDDLSGTAIGDAVGSLNEKLSSITEAFGESGLAGAASIGAASVIGSVAAIGAGLVTLALKTAEADEQLLRLAKRANTSTSNLQVLTAATGAYGLEMDSVGDILADAQEKLGEFSATGGGGLVDTLELMQNATKKTDAELEIFGKSLSTMDSVDAIQAVVNEMEKAGATTQEVRFVTESLASGLGDIIPLWDNNGEALRGYERDLNEAGVIRTKESIEQSQILSSELEGLQVELEGVSNKIVTATLPAMVGLIEYMKTGTTDADGLSDSLSSIGLVAAVIATPFIGLMSVFKQVGTVVAGLMSSISSLFSLMSNVISNPFKIGTYLQEYARSTGQIGVYMGEDFKAERDRTVSSLETIFSSPRELANKRAAAYGLSNLGTLVPGAGAASYGTGSANTQIVASRAMAKAAEDEAKEQEKLAKANDKTAKSLKDLGSAYVSNTALSGLKLKANEAIAGGKARGYTAEFAEVTQSLLGGNLRYFSAINDTYHAGSNSKHASGQAFDVVLKDAKKAKQAVEEIKAAAKEYGYSIKVLNEYSNPSKKATGGHLHVSVYGQKDNGKGGADIAWIKQQNSAASSEMQKAAADALKEQEQQERRQLNVQAKWAYEKEKIELDYQKDVAEVKAAHAEGSADYIKYMARVEEKYTNTKNAGMLSLSENYFSEETRIHNAHKKAMKVIEETYIEDDSVRQYFVDEQKAAYEEDLANFKFTAEAKARAQYKMYKSIADSARAGSMNALSTGKDSMMQRTLGDEDYSNWRLNQDYVEGFDSINNDYKNREAEINAIDERGNEAFPEIERFELLEIAKQEHLDKMWALEQEYALKDQTLAEQHASQKIAMYQSLFSGISGLASAFAGEQSAAYRISFAIEKGFAIAQAAMAIQQSIAKAMAFGVTPIDKAAYVGEAIASGAQIVSNIKSITMGGIAHGGLDYVPKEATYLLDEGERVLSPRQNKDLANFMASGQTNSSEVNINVSVDAKGNDQMTGDMSNALGRKMAEGMKQVAKNVIIQEKRQGGLLYGT